VPKIYKNYYNKFKDKPKIVSTIFFFLMAVWMFFVPVFPLSVWRDLYGAYHLIDRAGFGYMAYSGGRGLLVFLVLFVALASLILGILTVTKVLKIKILPLILISINLTLAFIYILITARFLIVGNWAMPAFIATRLSHSILYIKLYGK